MRPALFSLWLTVVPVSVLVHCRPRFPEAELPSHNQHDTFFVGAHADRPHDVGRFYSEPRGSTKRGVHRDFLVVLPERPDSSHFVAIFDLRRKRFLCMDPKGELYISRHKDKKGCLFRRFWLNLTKHHGVFYLTSGTRLLRLEGAELQVVDARPPELSAALLERLVAPPVRRQRRSEEVNPSDPLRSQSHPPPPSAKDHKDASHGQPEQDQASAVSKETISSCDDPLRVLRPNGPVSPVKTNIADRAEQD